MKFLAYEHDGERGVGILRDDGRVFTTPWADFDALFGEDDPLASALAVDLSQESEISIDGMRRLAPVVSRPQVIGTGGNYPEHAKEASAELTVKGAVFLPFLWGAIIGPDDEIVIPSPETLTDYEVEFSAVIGRTASRVTPETAMDHVFGFTLVNDVSARDVSKEDLMQMLLSKSPDTFLPIGPVVVTIDEFPDPYALGIRSYLNGELRQNSSTGAMGTRFAELLTRLTASVTLHPGDILTSGTPGGVGYFRTPQEFIHPGDVVSIEVDGIGRMSNTAVAGW